MTVVAATSINERLFAGAAFDPDTDRLLARVVEHTTEEYVDVHVGTQVVTCSEEEAQGICAELSAYVAHCARRRRERLAEQAEHAQASALAVVGERR